MVGAGLLLAPGVGLAEHAKLLFIWSHWVYPGSMALGEADPTDEWDKMCKRAGGVPSFKMQKFKLMNNPVVFTTVSMACLDKEGVKAHKPAPKHKTSVRF